MLVVNRVTRDLKDLSGKSHCPQCGGILRPVQRRKKDLVGQKTQGWFMVCSNYKPGPDRIVTDMGRCIYYVSPGDKSKGIQPSEKIWEQSPDES